MQDLTHRLVYFSRNQMPGSNQDIVAGIHQILASSRRNNAALGVTGALLFNSGCFAQVLEGPRAAVSRIFERIQRDPRHSDALVLEYAPVAKRSFPSWSMAFVGQRQKEQRLFGAISADSGFDPAHLSAEQIFSTLRRLVLEEEQVAA